MLTFAKKRLKAISASNLGTPAAANALYQASKDLTRDGPIAGSDGCDTADLADEFAPSVFDGIEDVRIGVEDGGGKVVAAQELPDIFRWIEFRTCCRQGQKRYVAGQFEFPGRVPAGLVKQDKGMGTGAYSATDLIDM